MCYTRFRISILKMFALAQIVNYCTSNRYIYLLAYTAPSYVLQGVCIPVHGLEIHDNIPIQMSASTESIHLKSQGPRAAINCLVILK